MDLQGEEEKIQVFGVRRRRATNIHAQMGIYVPHVERLVLYIRERKENYERKCIQT